MYDRSGQASSPLTRFQRDGELTFRQHLAARTNGELADIIVQLLKLLAEYENELSAVEAANYKNGKK